MSIPNLVPQLPVKIAIGAGVNPLVNSTFGNVSPDYSAPVWLWALVKQAF